jgi:hypothetical protein
VSSLPFDPDAVARQFGEEPPVPDRPRSGGLAASSAKEFLAEDIPDPEWLVTDIVPERAIGFIGGAPKVFKSWLALDLGMALTAGTAFCGRFACPTSRRTLIVQFESSRAHYQKRLRAITSRFPAVPEQLYIASNESLVFEDQVSIKRIDVSLDDLRPDLLILDPLAAMTHGDENSAQEMGAIVRQLRAWRDRYDCAIGVVHHTNKAAARTVDAARGGHKLRGSSAFYAAAEWALWIERPDEAAARLEVRVEQKEAEPRRPFAVEFREVGAELVVVQDEVTRQVTDNEILAAIIRRGKHATTQELVAELEVEDRTIQRRLKALLAGRKIYLQEGSGRGSKPSVWIVTTAQAAALRLLPERP